MFVSPITVRAINPQPFHRSRFTRLVWRIAARSYQKLCPHRETNASLINSKQIGLNDKRVPQMPWSVSRLTSCSLLRPSRSVEVTRRSWARRPWLATTTTTWRSRPCGFALRRTSSLCAIDERRGGKTNGVDVLGDVRE